jgi:hypothetical protein
MLPGGKKENAPFEIGLGIRDDQCDASRWPKYVGSAHCHYETGDIGWSGGLEKNASQWRRRKKMAE